MALFKIFKGDGSTKALPTTKTDGFCYFTYNDGKFYVDYADATGTLQRRALNAVQADSAAKLTTARQIIIEGAVNGSVTSWNGSKDLKVNVVLDTTWADKINDAYAHSVSNKGSAFSAGLYKITTNAEGHVTAATAVTKSDITALGIPSTNTDTKVEMTNTDPTAETNWYLLGSSVAATNTDSVLKNSDFKVKIKQGTTDATGHVSLILGNSTVTGTAGNKSGQLILFSANAGNHTITGASSASSFTHTLPAASGTLLNTGTTTWTDRDAATAKIGTLKLNGVDKILYDILLHARGQNITAAEITDINNIKVPSVYYSNNSTETSKLVNSPTSAASGYRLMTFAGYQGASSYGWQLAAASSEMYWRLLGTSNDSPTKWYGWIKFIYGKAKGSDFQPIWLTADGVPTVCSDYAGGTKVTLNNSDKGASTATIYAPTVGGTSGQYLKAVGTTSAPTWASFGNLTLKTTNTAGVSTTIGSYNSSAAGTLTVTAENLLPTYTSTHTSQLNANQWVTVTTPKGANNEEMGNGTYIIQVSTDAGEFFSGIMSWTKTTKVHTTIQYDEVVMHNAGTSVGDNHIGVRVYRDATTPKLQLCSIGTSKVSASTSAPITIKMRRII